MHNRNNLNKYRVWLTPIVFSVVIHVIIIVLVKHNTTLKKANSKPKQQSIKSYLVVAKPANKIKKAVEQKDKTTFVETKKTTIVQAQQQKEIEEVVTNRIKPSTKDITVSDPAATAQSMIKRPSLSTSLNYIRNQQVQAPASWQQYNNQQSQNKLQAHKKSKLRKKHNGDYLTTKNGITNLGKSTDGSALVKMGDGCYSIKDIESQGSVWMATKCPLSTDPLRQAYRTSKNKYLKSKIQ